MKVLVLTPEAFGGHGGIAKYASDLLTAVCAHPRVAEVIALPRLQSQSAPTLPDKLRWDTRGLGGKRRYAAAVLRSLATTGRVDLVVCAHLNLLPLAALAALRHRAPLCLVVYGIDAWAPPEGRMGRLAHGLVSRVDHVVSISETTLERYRRWAPAPRVGAHILPNAFDPAAFAPGPKPDTLQARYGLAGRTVLMTFGRMEASERYKGFDEMLDLLPRLRAEHPARDLVYLAVGDGTDRARLQESARALGLGAHVVFTGRIAEAEKADHYRLADVYVMPSYGEGFGFVFLEAMASGIPVVASRADGSREAVRDGLLGALVDPKDPDAIARAIAESLRKPRGVIPAGLDYFAWPSFEARTRAFVDAALSD